MKNYLQRNKYSEAIIVEHMHVHCEEMKAQNRVWNVKTQDTQDEDKQTEEIELRKLRKSSVKVFKQI